MSSFLHNKLDISHTLKHTTMYTEAKAAEDEFMLALITIMCIVIFILLILEEHREKKLIKVDTAKKETENSNRKEPELIKEINKLIKANIRKGHTFIPDSFTEVEKSVIKKKLQDSGYTISGNRIEWAINY